ncbi:hypothetical protein R6Q57_024997 [Mikania cordata]
MYLRCCMLVKSFDTDSNIKSTAATSTSTNTPSSKWLEPYRIYISDVDVESIIYQCNAPQGPTLLHPGDMFTWRFRKDLFGENKYDCWFGWTHIYELKKMSFNVFDKQVAKMCGRNLFKMNRCYWLITKSGAYFSKRNETFLYHSDDNWRYMHQWS